MKCIHNILIIYPIFQRRLGNLIEDISANLIRQLALSSQFSMNRAEVRIIYKKKSPRRRLFIRRVIQLPLLQCKRNPIPKNHSPIQIPNTHGQCRQTSLKDNSSHSRTIFVPQSYHVRMKESQLSTVNRL